MTSSSGPGISLMQEGLSFMVGSQLPAVIVNISRSGPGWAASRRPRATISRRPRAGPRRRAPHLPRPALGPGDVFPDDARVRPRRQVPQPRHDPRGRDHRADEGAVRPVPYVPAVPEKPWALTGAKGRAAVREIHVPEGRRDRGAQLDAPGQVPEDPGGGGPLRSRTCSRGEDRDRRLRDRGARRQDRDPVGPEGRDPRRDAPPDHAVPLPGRGGPRGGRGGWRRCWSSR